MGEAKKVNSPVALIMAGGSGTRFWPLSQKNLPKQYLRFSGEKSLIQQTVERIRTLCKTEDIYISSSGTQKSLLQEHLPDISNLILEPTPKNTAACLMLSAATLLKRGYAPSTPMMVFPADHAIGNSAHFVELLKKAVSFASSQNSLVTLGIIPTSPHTGYGYIESGELIQADVLTVKRFTEKPEQKTAEAFLKQGGYFWNSGIFIWTLGSIAAAFDSFLSESWKRILDCDSEATLKEVFNSLPSLPIDTAVMERAKNVFVLPAGDLQWSDLGSWSALFELKTQNAKENVFLSGNVKQMDASGCLVQVSSGLNVALIGTEDLVVIEHNGNLLIAKKSLDQKVKDISQQFEA
ncbi:MAG: mannose-1-phosphate guanylyltransferase [Proteobacteria bacterium]|nr:mannose-1-phosphate guanylyltransferase [Pseudomonadota bacterium]